MGWIGVSFWKHAGDAHEYSKISPICNLNIVKFPRFVTYRGRPDFGHSPYPVQVLFPFCVKVGVASRQLRWKVTVSWGVTSRSYALRYRCCKGTYCHHLQSRIFFTLKMEAAHSSQTLVIYIRLHDVTFHMTVLYIRPCGSLKPHICICTFSIAWGTGTFDIHDVSRRPCTPVCKLLVAIIPI
jgi:hypothetical protein